MPTTVILLHECTGICKRLGSAIVKANRVKQVVITITK